MSFFLAVVLEAQLSFTCKNYRETDHSNHYNKQNVKCVFDEYLIHDGSFNYNSENILST